MQQNRTYDPTLNDFHEVIQPRATGGGHVLYTMHYELHYVSHRGGELLVGLCTMIMLVTLATGVVAHRKILREFFVFRPRKGPRSWLDIHNVAGVLALPFYVMITFSGLIFFLFTYMPSAMQVHYGGDSKIFQAELSPRFDGRSRANSPATLLPLEHFLSEAKRYWGDDSVNSISVSYPGDINATVELSHTGKGTILRETLEELHFDGVTGELILQETAEKPSVYEVESALFGLHEGIFAGWALRWLYFGSGLLGCVMIATGLVLWAVKRRATQMKFGSADAGFRLVECLNVGTIAGLPVGIAAYFWANRLLPVTLAERAEWEVHSMFIAWGVMLLWALIRVPDKAWVEVLLIAAATFGLLPLVNAFTTDRHLGITLPHGDWVLASFDLTVLATGILFAMAGIIVRRKWTTSVAQPRSLATAEILS